MKLFDEVQKTIELGHSLIDVDIPPIVLLSKQLLDRPYGFAVCRTNEYLPEDEGVDYIFPIQPMRLTVSNDASAHSVWLPYLKHNDLTMVGVVITPMVYSDFIHIYMEEHAKNTMVMLTFVMSCGSLIKSNRMYNWKHISDMQVDDFFIYILKDNIHRNLYDVLGNAKSMIDDRVHPTHVTNIGISSVYPFEVRLSESMLLEM